MDERLKQQIKDWVYNLLRESEDTPHAHVFYLIDRLVEEDWNIDWLSAEVVREAVCEDLFQITRLLTDLRCTLLRDS